MPSTSRWLLCANSAVIVETNITANPVTSQAPTGRSQRNERPRDCPTKKAPEKTLSSIMIAESNAALSALPEGVPRRNNRLGPRRPAAGEIDQKKRHHERAEQRQHIRSKPPVVLKGTAGGETDILLDVQSADVAPFFQQLFLLLLLRRRCAEHPVHQ